ncbi:DUF3006 family protein [Rubrobacter aplysinae]|uniref:DUF3006 family protein n=1 Tax=Rubrobacter aplysinae TaxID=909625 RepID=UPI00064BF435|nr:DUF3006 family protein [Rubrobacter aplysinae]
MALTATVDNVEGDQARLLVGEDELQVSLSELPEGTEKGDILRFEFALSQRTEAGAWKEPGREEG